MTEKQKYFSEYRRKNKDRLNAYRREYYQKNKDKFRQWQKTSLERRIQRGIEERMNKDA